MMMTALEIGAKLLDKFIPDEGEAAKARAELEQQLLQAETEARQGQLEINKAEATHNSIFVAGWRPFIGWVCGLGIAWVFLVQPVTIWAGAAFGFGVNIPMIPSEGLFELVFAMLGMGGLRTFEKMKGIAREK